MTEGDATERVAVQTYVPAYQKRAWAADADELGMNQAEYVRTMVQAGRRELGLDVGKEDRDAAEAPTDDADLEGRVLDLLRTEGCLDWEELVAGLTGDLEARLEETLEDLQGRNQVRHSPRRDGYEVVDGGE